MASELSTNNIFVTKQWSQVKSNLVFSFIFPVYPQKQQYAYAGYPAPAAYPGPYYHGSQYGPYNYWKDIIDRIEGKKVFHAFSIIKNSLSRFNLAERGLELFRKSNISDFVYDRALHGKRSKWSWSPILGIMYT